MRIAPVSISRQYQWNRQGDSSHHIMKSPGLLLRTLLITCSISPILSHIFGVNNGYQTRTQCSEGSDQPSARTDKSDILNKLREEMRRASSVSGNILDAYIIPSFDEHQSEDPSDRDRRLLYVSGFSGSDGTAVITLNSAALWTDGRYLQQADTELSCMWNLMNDSKSTTIPQWLLDQLSPKNTRTNNRELRVGADPRLIPHYLWQQWEKVLNYGNIRLIQIINNLVDIVWQNRPGLSRAEVYIQSKEYSGKTWLTKVLDLRKELAEKQIDAMIVTALDEIAWLLNIRAKDLPYSPVVKAYLVISKDLLNLYVDGKKLSLEAKKSLLVDQCYSPNCTRIRTYDSVWIDLRTNSHDWKVVLLPAQYSLSSGVSEAIYTAIPEEKRLYIPSPIIKMKAIKNAKEIEGMRRAHIRDGAAMCEALSYIEHKIKNTDEIWDELKVATIVDKMRRSQNLNKGLSFPTIAGFGPNGAIPHYTPTNITTRRITKDSTLVLDSGGQYLDGTTDITRTLHYGKPNKEQKKAYTLVLMASIDLSLMIFPSDLNMNDIDVMARKSLWTNHKNYMHSTGHGIGSFLQAHEAPIQIAYNDDLNAEKKNENFEPGYFFSNEPGYYVEGNFGVRLENILEVVRDTEKNAKPGKTNYLKFEDITLVPYEPKLIDVNMLTLYQRRWLNKYNSRVRELVGAELKNRTKMNVFYWMMNKTVNVPEYGMVGTAPCISNANYLLLISFTVIMWFRNVRIN